MLLSITPYLHSVQRLPIASENSSETPSEKIKLNSLEHTFQINLEPSLMKVYKKTNIQGIPKVPIVQAQARSNGSIIQIHANPKFNVDP